MNANQHFLLSLQLCMVFCVGKQRRHHNNEYCKSDCTCIRLQMYCQPSPLVLFDHTIAFGAFFCATIFRSWVAVLVPQP